MNYCKAGFFAPPKLQGMEIMAKCHAESKNYCKDYWYLLIIYYLWYDSIEDLSGILPCKVSMLYTPEDYIEPENDGLEHVFPFPRVYSQVLS